MREHGTRLAGLFAVRLGVEGRLSQQNTVLLRIDVQLAKLLFAVQIAGGVRVAVRERRCSSFGARGGVAGLTATASPCCSSLPQSRVRPDT